MSVRSGHQSGCVWFGHRPFVSGSVTSIGLVPLVTSQASGHQLTGPMNTGSTSSSVGPSWPSPGHVVPSWTIHPDHSVRLDLGSTLSALHHTMDLGRVSSPPLHKAGRRSLPMRVPIITDGVIGIVLFLGVDPIAGHAIDRDDNTQGELTPSNAGLFGGIAEIEGVNYL